jgi:hypothetical protein
MLVALDTGGCRVEARRGLEPGLWRCPLCAGTVFLKRGARKIAHFAHAARLDCPLSGEGEVHLSVKLGLVEHLRALGWVCEPEVALDPTRIVDVLAVRPGDRARLAIEIQASPISVAEMDRRVTVDGGHGVTTGWLFTEGRLAASAPALVPALLGVEPLPLQLRLPPEVIHLHRRYRCGIFVAASPGKEPGRPSLQVARLELGAAWTPARLDGVYRPPHRLRATLRLTRVEWLQTPRLELAEGRADGDDTVIFTADTVDSPPSSAGLAAAHDRDERGPGLAYSFP